MTLWGLKARFHLSTFAGRETVLLRTLFRTKADAAAAIPPFEAAVRARGEGNPFAELDPQMKIEITVIDFDLPDMHP